MNEWSEGESVYMSGGAERDKLPENGAAAKGQITEK